MKARTLQEDHEEFIRAIKEFAVPSAPAKSHAPRKEADSQVILQELRRLRLQQLLAVLHVTWVVFRPIVLLGVLGFLLCSSWSLASIAALAAKVSLLGLLVAEGRRMLQDPVYHRSLLGDDGSFPEISFNTCGVFGKRMKSIMDLCSFEHFRYSPTFWLLNGDMHTMLPVLVRPMKSPTSDFLRVRLKLSEDSDQPLDIAIPSKAAASTVKSSKLLLLILAGVGGDSRQAYISDLCKRAAEEGHLCAVIVSKGFLSDEVDSVKRIFSPCDFDSLEKTVNITCKSAQSASLKVMSVGFSMGAIMWLTYHGKKKSPENMIGCISVGSAMKMDFSMVGRYPRIIQPALVTELVSDIMAKYGHEILRLVGQDGVKKFCRSRTFADLHKNLLSKIGKSDEQNLWFWMEKQEPHRWRNKISIPTLIFNAKDDPMHVMEQCGFEKETPSNPNVAYFLTQAGGHIGWCEGMSLRSTNYMVSVILRYARACKCEHDRREGLLSSWEDAVCCLHKELEDRRMQRLLQDRFWYSIFMAGSLFVLSITTFLHLSTFKTLGPPTLVKNALMVGFACLFAEVCYTLFASTSFLGHFSTYSRKVANDDET